MSLSCSDAVESLSAHLEAAGYTIDEGRGDDDDDDGFFFRSPGGDTGETHADSLAATMDAMDHFFARARIPTALTVV